MDLDIHCTHVWGFPFCVSEANTVTAVVKDNDITNRWYMSVYVVSPQGFRFQ